MVLYTGVDDLKRYRYPADDELWFYEGVVVADAISEIVALNIVGVRQDVVLNPDMAEPNEARVKQLYPWFSQRFEAGTLIEAIWCHLANLVTSRTSIAICKECGSYYERTDKRSQFCPAPEDHKLQARYGNRNRAVSLCAARNRTRRHRAKKQDSGQ